jgi:hypothetical protein
LHDHEHRNGEVNEFDALVEISRDDRDRGEVYVCSEGAMRGFSEYASAKQDILYIHESSHSPKKRRKRRKADNPPFISIGEDAVWFFSDDTMLVVPIGRLGTWRWTWRQQWVDLRRFG